MQQKANEAFLSKPPLKTYKLQFINWSKIINTPFVLSVSDKIHFCIFWHLQQRKTKKNRKRFLWPTKIIQIRYLLRYSLVPSPSPLFWPLPLPPPPPYHFPHYRLYHPHTTIVVVATTCLREIWMISRVNQTINVSRLFSELQPNTRKQVIYQKIYLFFLIT